MDDLEKLTGACHRRDIMVCLDFVMNHTSDEHEWAKAARSGDEGASPEDGGLAAAHDGLHD